MELVELSFIGFGGGGGSGVVLVELSESESIWGRYFKINLKIFLIN